MTDSEKIKFLAEMVFIHFEQLRSLEVRQLELLKLVEPLLPSDHPIKKDLIAMARSAEQLEAHAEVNRQRAKALRKQFGLLPPEE